MPRVPSVPCHLSHHFCHLCPWQGTFIWEFCAVWGHYFAPLRVSLEIHSTSCREMELFEHHGSFHCALPRFQRWALPVPGGWEKHSQGWEMISCPWTATPGPAAHPAGTAKDTKGQDGSSAHPWAGPVPTLQEKGQEWGGQEIPAPLQAELSQINTAKAVRCCAAGEDTALAIP